LYKLTNLPYTPESILEQARDIAMKAGMKYVYIGNVPGTTFENTYCPHCKKLIIERQGFAILQNNLKSSSCKFCGTKIAGIWE
jgi:pyruvate formate lyase activating enzyme